MKEGKERKERESVDGMSYFQLVAVEEIYRYMTSIQREGNSPAEVQR